MFSEATFAAITYVDSDRPGSTTTRTSTFGVIMAVSGGVAHLYARTQTTVAQPSGEAELYASSSGTAETMGVIQLLHDRGVRAGSYVRRYGYTPRPRASLWPRGHERAELQRTFDYAMSTCRTWCPPASLRLRKVPREENIAGLHTRFLPVARACYLRELQNLRSAADHHCVHATTAHSNFTQWCRRHCSCMSCPAAHIYHDFSVGMPHYLCCVAAHYIDACRPHNILCSQPFLTTSRDTVSCPVVLLRI